MHRLSHLTLGRSLFTAASLTLASLMAFSPATNAAEFIAEAGSVAPEGTPWAEWLTGVQKRIQKDSKGRIQLKVFLASRRGGEKEMIEDTRKNRLQLFGGSVGAIAAKYAPELAVFELPFIFNSDAEADFVLNEVRGEVSKILEQKGFIMVMWSENGWHGLGTKDRCLAKPEDLKGLKMRSQESMIHAETFKAFGASPEEMPVPEVLHSLQTGVVDGFSNTPLFSQAVSWHTGIKNYTYTQHIYQPALIVLSKAWYDGLPKDLQEVMASTKEEKSGIEGIRALTPLLLENFKASGVTVCPFTAESRKAFGEKVGPVYAKFKAQSAANKKMFDLVMAAKKKFAAK